MRYDDFRRRSRFLPLPAVGPGGTQRLQSDAFSPKASLSYRTGFGQVYFSYGRGFNSNFGPTFENDPNQYFRPDLKPTTLDSFELGAKGETRDGVLRVEAAAYYTRQSNRRVIVPNPAAETDFEAPNNLVTFGDLLTVRGVEVATTIKPDADTRFQVNYSFTDSAWDRFSLSTFAGPVDLSGRRAIGVPRHTVFVSADQRFTPWLSGRALFEWYGDYAVTLDNRIEDGGYELVTFNARIEPQRWRGLALDLTLLNAFDREYFFFFGGRTNPTYATPGLPRQFRATVSARF